MLSAGIKELKDNLSRYLSYVKRGEDVLITERGKIIARIVREPARNKYIREALSSLVSEGTIIAPSRKINKKVQVPVELPGRSLSEMVIEDRR